MKKFLRTSIFLTFFLIVFFANMGYVQAEPFQGPTQSGVTLDATNKGIIPDGGKMQSGDYELNDFVLLAINISQWILGITGSLTLLMFVYGGVMFLISAGSSDKVAQAKNIIIGATIGLAIIFASYTIIGFVISTMGVQVAGSGWASANWFR